MSQEQCQGHLGQERLPWDKCARHSVQEAHQGMCPGRNVKGACPRQLLGMTREQARLMTVSSDAVLKTVEAARHRPITLPLVGMATLLHGSCHHNVRAHMVKDNIRKEQKSTHLSAIIKRAS